MPLLARPLALCHLRYALCQQTVHFAKVKYEDFEFPAGTGASKMLRLCFVARVLASAYLVGKKGFVRECCAQFQLHFGEPEPEAPRGRASEGTAYHLVVHVILPVNVLVQVVHPPM